MIEGEISVALRTPRANRDVDECPNVPMPISLMPVDERVGDRIAEISCALRGGDSHRSLIGAGFPLRFVGLATIRSYLKLGCN